MKFLYIIAVSLIAFHCQGQHITGKVVRIADGDSFTLLMENKQEIRVRLYGIDCPEKGQPYSQVAKEFTGNILQKGKVVVEQKDIDRYNRIVGIVIVADSINLNEQLLRSGLAWHYRIFDKNPVWEFYEHEAKAAELGLWKDRYAIAPWLWRKGVRSEAEANAVSGE